MTKKQHYKRAFAVLAMEYLAKLVNDEEVMETWLMNGVADGDIGLIRDYISFDDWFKDSIEYIIQDQYYITDSNFSDLMGTFLLTMKRAQKSGGLYCDGIVSN